MTFQEDSNGNGDDFETIQDTHPSSPLKQKNELRSHSELPEIERIKDNTSKILLRFISSDDKPPAIKMEFKNMSAKVPKMPGSKELKTILNDVSGTIYPGEFVALMGPSGAGKSTLLNVLGNRFDGKWSGDIYINAKLKDKRIKKYLGYVLQHDTLLPNLTVYETLSITAFLRLPKTLSKIKKMERVDDIIHVMGLNKCKNTSVTQISGGESKRLSIANELLINPSILFLDEPISGLDSTTALSILNTLKNLCKKGRTVICAIHQPSSQMFNKFDKLALMASSELIYFGKVSRVLNYFDNVGYKCPIHYNPADFLLELITDNLTNENDKMFNKDKKDIIKHLQDEWRVNQPSMYADETEACKGIKIDNIDVDITPESKSKWNTTWFEQFRLLFYRAFKHRRGHLISWLRFFDLGMICFLGGMLWFQIAKTEKNLNDFMAGTFFIQIYLLFMTMYFGVVHFPTEKLVIKKERQSGAYRLSAYYISKILAETPIDILIPMIGITLFFWLAGFSKYFVAYILYLLGSVLGIFVANAYGIMLGCSVNAFDKALTLLNVSGMFMMSISGFFIKDTALPGFMKPFKYLSFMRYSYLNTLNVLLNYNKFKCEIDSLYERCDVNNPNYDGYIYAKDILDFYEIREPVWLGVVILFSLLCVYLTIAYWFLRRNTKTIS